MSSNRVYYSQEAEDRVKREQTMSNLLFLGLGMAIGTVSALLLAPYKGAKSREELSSWVGENFESGREATSSALGRIERQISDLYGQIENRFSS
jgi:gas vesicle protein